MIDFTKKLFLTLFLNFTFSILLMGQNYVRQLGIPVTANNNSMLFPWVGGMDACIFNEIDLNGDGIQDLFLFEKEGPGDYEGTFRMSTFINTGIPNQVSYVYAPQFESKLPASLHNWAVTVDYDCDGKKDIFAYAAAGGVEVWHNDFDSINGLSFHLEYPLLYTHIGISSTNLLVTRVNQAALVDIDGDGDLDVLCQQNAGNLIEYHRNKAKEFYNRCDTLVMYEDVDNWGQDTLNSNGNFIVNLPTNCPFNSKQSTPHFRISDPGYKELRHSGTCMTAFDRDGDGDMDLLNGDLLASNLLYIQNCGTPDTACGCSQDTIYPSYNLPANLVSPMPGPYYMDVDNDGNKDLIVTPCFFGLTVNENYNNILFYKNVMNNQNNVFSYVQNRLLVEDMIDVGSNAMPVILDVDGDGLNDLMVGNYGYFDKDSVDFKSGLTFFRNVGNAQCPSFRLENRYYDSLITVGFLGVKPTFGDLDGDGDKDMIFGESNGSLVYCTNISGMAQSHWSSPIANYGGIDVGDFSTPQLVDVDRDSLLDLLIGEKDGNINYFRNAGTPFSPVFTYMTSNFGGVNTLNPQGTYGYSVPLLFEGSNGYELLVGSESGDLFHFNNIDNNLTGIFNLIDSNAYGIHEAGRCVPMMGDLNNDNQAELVIGNYAGGLTMYSQSMCNPLAVNDHNLSVQVSIYPNPASDFVIIKMSNNNAEKRKVEIYDILGQKVYSSQTQMPSVNINTRNLESGIYVCRIVENGQIYVRRFTIKK